MSRENVEVVREMNEAFNRGDYAAALSALASDVEWNAPSGVSIGEEVYRGHDAVRKGFALWLDAWETYRFEPAEIPRSRRSCGFQRHPDRSWSWQRRRDPAPDVQRLHVA